MLSFLSVQEVCNVISRSILKYQTCDVQHVWSKLPDFHFINGLLRKFCKLDSSLKPYWVRYSEQISGRRRETGSPFGWSCGATR